MKVKRMIKSDVSTFKVGDIIKVKLTDGEKAQAMAVQQEEDGMVFCLVDCLAKEYPMNETRTNEGGYEASDLRKKLNAPTVAACTYAMQLKSLSIKEMLGMRYAQFLKSDDWKHASVIVSDEPEKFKVTDKDTPAPRIVSPYDIPGIYDLIFGKENQ